MLTFPRAKINIGLNITEKRADGYHSIETLFYPIGLSDILEVVADPENMGGTCQVSLSGIKLEGNPGENLVEKAYRLVNERYGLPSVLTFLHKGIPSGAGLGGGSSDGASMLLILNELFSLNQADAELSALALELGSDCPFFLDMQPSMATGRGEILSAFSVELAHQWILLFHPGTGISTAEAYRNIKPALPGVLLKDALNRPLADWRHLISNDFEPYAFNRVPLIRRIRDELYESGACFSSMTGSGSAVFGLFRTMPEIPEDILPYLIWKEMIP